MFPPLVSLHLLLMRNFVNSIHFNDKLADRISFVTFDWMISLLRHLPFCTALRIGITSSMIVSSVFKYLSQLTRICNWAAFLGYIHLIRKMSNRTSPIFLAVD